MKLKKGECIDTSGFGGWILERGCWKLEKEEEKEEIEGWRKKKDCQILISFKIANENFHWQFNKLERPMKLST